MQLRRKSRISEESFDYICSAFVHGYSCENISRTSGLNRNTVALHFQKIRECMLRQAISESISYLYPGGLFTSLEEKREFLLQNVTNRGSLVWNNEYARYLLPFNFGWLSRLFPDNIDRINPPLKFGSHRKTITTHSAAKYPVIWCGEFDINDTSTFFKAYSLNLDFAEYLARYRGIAASNLLFYLVEFLFFYGTKNIETRKFRLDHMLKNDQLAY